MSGFISSFIRRATVTYDHWDEWTKHRIGSGDGMPSQPGGNGGNGGGLSSQPVTVQYGAATLVNGVVKITTDHDGNAITLKSSSAIQLTVKDYDDVDVPILTAPTAQRIYGGPGLGNPASFTVYSKSNENSSFDWTITG